MATDHSKSAITRRAGHYLQREALRARAGLFAILDSARAEVVPAKLEQSEAESVSLYKGEPEESLAHVAPYLVQLDPEGELLTWVSEQGWGDSWGVFLTSEASLEDLRQHFRRFLMVKDDEGKRLYFRFYDPRVLRTYLPTCAADEIKLFFGPVVSYLLESEDGEQLLRYSLKDDKGALESIGLSQVGGKPEVTVLEPAVVPKP